MSRKPHTETEYRYAPVPQALLYDTTLTDKAIRVYACLARHGMDPGSCYPSHARIGELIGAAARSIQRPLRDLEAAGWIERVRRVDETGARTSDGFLVRTTSAHERAPTALFSAGPPAQEHRAPVRVEREQENESQKEREGAAARQVAERVWERADPKPATPFIGAMKLASRLLAAGHEPDAIVEAMTAVPTISTGWVEAELARRRGKRAKVGLPIDEDRDAPGGKVDWNA